RPVGARGRLFELIQYTVRPYHVDNTTPHPLCEVKRCRVRLLLRWGTTWGALLQFLKP
ncbi:unnamed protein product, partial [Sphacelaria rigidula]